MCSAGRAGSAGKLIECCSLKVIYNAVINCPGAAIPAVDQVRYSIQKIQEK